MSSQYIKPYGLRAKKRLGQHFLHDSRIISQILDAARIGPETRVVEIGAGLGALTLALVKKARDVIALERDPELVQLLQNKLGYHANLTITQADALRVQYHHFGANIHVVGNLPYNIASPLIFRLLDFKAYIRQATLMVQKEVADRLVAPPNTRDYGVPSILVQRLAEVTICFRVPASAFTPRPKVESAVVQIVPRPIPLVPLENTLFSNVVRVAFQQRRKMLANALAAQFPRDAIDAALEKAGISGKRRGETLSIDEFARITDGLE